MFVTDLLSLPLICIEEMFNNLVNFNAIHEISIIFK
jgi:hypothetical protein